MLARSVTHLSKSLAGLWSSVSMGVTVLEHFRREHAATPCWDSSVEFAHRVLEHFRREFRRDDGSFFCVRTSFTIPPRIPLNGPVQLKNLGDEDFGDVHVWDWRRFIAALPRENYNNFTGGAGILQIGLRPILGTVDSDGGPVWDFYLDLDRNPALTVYIHPELTDTVIKRWSTRSDNQRAAELAALLIVNPDCGRDSVAILYESTPLDLVNVETQLQSSGSVASSSSSAVSLSSQHHSFLQKHPPQCQRSCGSSETVHTRHRRLSLWTIVEFDAVIDDWASDSWSSWDQSGAWWTSSWEWSSSAEFGWRTDLESGSERGYSNGGHRSKVAGPDGENDEDGLHGSPSQIIHPHPQSQPK